MFIVAVRVDGEVEFFEFDNEQNARAFMQDCNESGAEAIMTAEAVNE